MITLADLPGKHTRQWVASRKAAVVRAVLCGLTTAESALKIIDVFNHKLRKKWSIGTNVENNIETVSGRGYVLHHPEPVTEQ